MTVLGREPGAEPAVSPPSRAALCVRGVGGHRALAVSEAVLHIRAGEKPMWAAQGNTVTLAGICKSRSVSAPELPLCKSVHQNESTEERWELFYTFFECGENVQRCFSERKAKI